MEKLVNSKCVIIDRLGREMKALHSASVTVLYIEMLRSSLMVTG
jgi:hypothetical protein